MKKKDLIDQDQINKFNQKLIDDDAWGFCPHGSRYKGSCEKCCPDLNPGFINITASKSSWDFLLNDVRQIDNYQPLKSQDMIEDKDNENASQRMRNMLMFGVPLTNGQVKDAAPGFAILGVLILAFVVIWTIVK